jgi:hypothetical protein
MLVFISAIAQNKKVQVLLEIDWQEVRQAYPSRVNEIESLLRDTIIYSLKNMFPFFDFTDDTVDYKLEIKILDPNTGGYNTPRHAVAFQLLLAGNPIRPNTEMVTLPINNFGTTFVFPREYYSFVSRIAGSFIVGLSQFNDLIIQSLLSHIPIANDAFFFSNPQTWAIPISFNINRIAKESHILIEFYPSDQVYGIRQVESVVNSAICDIQRARSNYNLPDKYPFGCLVLRRLNGPTDISDTLYTKKLVYVTKYNLFKTVGLVFDNNNECDVYNQ